MLDGLTPRQFAEWIAFRRLQPDPLDRLIRIVKLGFAALCNSWGAKLEPDDLDPLKPEQRSGPDAVTPEQGAALFSTVFGKPK